MKKALSFICLCAMLVSVAACGSSAKEFSATGKGYGGDITVTITVEENKMTDVKIKGDKETPTIGSTAVEQLPEKILKANSYDVEVVTGATVTSTAIKDLTKEAMKKAGLIK